MKFLKSIGRSFIDFYTDGGLMLAGSMSFFTMMAFVPFCLFIITLFSHLLGQYPEFYRFFLNKLVNFFPDVTHEITRDIYVLISNKGIGKFSLFLYGLLSYQVFASYETALNTVFKVKKKRNIIFSILISFLVVTLIISILILSFAASSIIPLLKVLSPFLPGLKIGKITYLIIRFILPFILILFIITMIFYLIPKKRVRLSTAFKGAIFTTTFLEVAKYIFTWYISTVAQFGKIYGPLSAFIIFLLWIFYSSSIFLIGAELVYILGYSKKG